jgi:hypothetical protein
VRKAGLKGVMIMAGLALLASGCRTDREVTEPEPLPVTDKRLTAALLTEDDLSASFTAAAKGTAINAEPIPEHRCDDAITELEAKESVSADFTADGMVLSNAVAWFPGGGGAVDQLFRDIAEDCASVVVADQDLSVLTTGLRFGVLSDDTVALQFEVRPTVGPSEERDLILIREGDLVSVVRLTGPRPSDKVLLDSVVRTSIGRLGQLSADTT